MAFTKKMRDSNVWEAVPRERVTKHVQSSEQRQLAQYHLQCMQRREEIREDEGETMNCSVRVLRLTQQHEIIVIRMTILLVFIFTLICGLYSQLCKNCILFTVYVYILYTLKSKVYSKGIQSKQFTCVYIKCLRGALCASPYQRRTRLFQHGSSMGGTDYSGPHGAQVVWQLLLVLQYQQRHSLSM
jgi:hypothetical protein